MQFDGTVGIDEPCAIRIPKRDHMESFAAKTAVKHADLLIHVFLRLKMVGKHIAGFNGCHCGRTAADKQFFGHETDLLRKLV